MKFTFVLFLFFLMCVPQAEIYKASAQERLSNQFDAVFQNSNNFQEYKVVKRDELEMLKRSSLDSVASLKIKIEDIQKELQIQTQLTMQIKDSLKVKSEELQKLLLAQDSISFLGKPISKSNYSLLMWSLVLILVVLLTVYIFRFSSAKRISNDAVEHYTKLESEFDSYKQKALEKEQKLGRQLQDEINKHKDSSK